MQGLSILFIRHILLFSKKQVLHFFELRSAMSASNAAAGGQKTADDTGDVPSDVKVLSRCS
jgi:hypothetical protein